MDWKNSARQCLTAAGRRLATGRSGRRVILCYHSIHPTNSFRSASPALFAKHLQWLKKHCELVSLKALLESREEGTAPSRPRVAITFDDGYCDNYEHAFPLLQKYGTPAAFFLTVGFLERADEVNMRLNVKPEDLQPLTWEQVREMRRAGMEFGVHTYSHSTLPIL